MHTTHVNLRQVTYSIKSNTVYEGRRLSWTDGLKNKDLSPRRSNLGPAWVQPKIQYFPNKVVFLNLKLLLGNFWLVQLNTDWLFVRGCSQCSFIRATTSDPVQAQLRLQRGLTRRTARRGRTQIRGNKRGRRSEEGSSGRGLAHAAPSVAPGS